MYKSNVLEQAPFSKSYGYWKKIVRFSCTIATLLLDNYVLMFYNKYSDVAIEFDDKYECGGDKTWHFVSWKVGDYEHVSK
jgi:hypothetical protein